MIGFCYICGNFRRVKEVKLVYRDIGTSVELKKRLCEICLELGREKPILSLCGVYEIKNTF